MTTLGIVGGIAPESTIQYYRSIIALYQEYKGDGSYPQIIINSIDLTKMLGMVRTNDLTALTDHLSEEVSRLERAGADFGLFASNTPHLVFDEIQRRSPIPLVSIVEATSRVAQSLGLTRVGLFGTRFTMQGDFYTKVFARKGIEIVVPESEDQEYIHDKYMNELVRAEFLDETRVRMLSIVDKLIERENLQGLILGGTELPFILREESHAGIPFLDTTKIHVAEAVTRMLA